MRLKSLPADGKLYDVFAWREIFELSTGACEQFTRAPSAMSPGVRELCAPTCSA